MTKEEGHTRCSGLTGRGEDPGWRGIEWLWCDDEERKDVLPRHHAGIYAFLTGPSPPPPHRQRIRGMELSREQSTRPTTPSARARHRLHRANSMLRGGRVPPNGARRHIDGTCNGTQASSAWPSLHPDIARDAINIVVASSPPMDPAGRVTLDRCLLPARSGAHPRLG